MNISILLRVVADALAEGRIAGRAEVVDTGESVLFKDQDEMLAFIQKASIEPPPAAPIEPATDGSI
jgi:hypothetical protein